MYDELGQLRHKRIRGPVFTIFGTFVLIYSTAMVILFLESYAHLYLAAGALGMALLADLGIRSRQTLYGIALFAASGGLLAVEAALLARLFPNAVSAGYAFIVSAGALLVLRGVHDVQEAQSVLRRGEEELPKIFTR